jgi:DNA primase
MAFYYNKEKKMTLSIDEIKGLNMVDLLSKHYGMQFTLKGGEYVSFSAFTDERNPSFFVRQVDGDWLFKDFSSGHGGSFIDFVILKEGFSKVTEALAHIRKLLEQESGQETMLPQMESKKEEKKGYNIENIYRKIRSNDTSVCRQYLRERGICEEVIGDLIKGGILLHNQYQGNSYCCFAVFDQNGALCCLDNHGIDNESKFVLGKKVIFTYDWEILPCCERVFVCEGIIDYLSMKTLEGKGLPGVALLGNRIRFDTGLFTGAKRIILALDGDAGGFKAVLDLQEKFADREFLAYDIGKCKDPNEYLQALKSGQDPTNLTARDKLTLYQEFIQAENKSEVALKWGVNRSYMYEIIKDCEEIILEGFTQRRPGRKPAKAPCSLTDAIKQISTLEEEKRQETTEKERFYARSEFLKLRLKWAEIETEELRGGQIQNSEQPPKKKQIKKKKRKKQ